MNIKDILRILACPKCHGNLSLTEAGGDKKGLLCESCQIVYPIEDDIPVLLINRALSLQEWNEGKTSCTEETHSCEC
ncbi:MAG: hypothetical protein K5657_01600 [Desulfovibrio sp.]|nr:hypothetical protein [Desulfovibrio sp.]